MDVINPEKLQHLLIDNSLTFDGFHWNYPREIYGEIHYKFGF